MTLADKIRYLREVEGQLRNLNRAMTQQEVVQAIQSSEKGGKTISQSYLSQIESGSRPHLTNTTRLLLARFFQVHPGYLVDDPEGYNAQLLSDLSSVEDKLDLWLVSGAERFRRDPCLGQALLTLARHNDSRQCLLLLESILETPNLLDRLTAVLRPEALEAAGSRPASKTPGAPSLTASSSRVASSPLESAEPPCPPIPFNVSVPAAPSAGKPQPKPRKRTQN